MRRGRERAVWWRQGCLLAALAAGGCGNVHTPATTVDAGSGDSASGGNDSADRSGADTGPPLTIDQACTDLNTSICGALQACSTFLLQLAYGDVATCVARTNLGCTMGQAASGVGRTLEDLENCARAIPTVSCADLIAHKTPAACQDKPGTVINGLSCGAGTQCQSTFCRKQGACGVCAPREAVGGVCINDEHCRADLVCVPTTSRCAVPGEMGAGCDDMRPCRADLYCRAGACAAKVGAGESCADSDTACDPTRGVACNSVSKVCQSLHVAKKGEACGIVNAMVVLCEAAGSCEGEAQARPACTAATGDGEACGAAVAGRGCLGPASCVVGICRLPATPSCN
jgi:hypothetical protein